MIHDVSQHPIVAQLEPSPEQAPAIAARGADVAVTAGAGAGKTRTLVARYLSLLAEGLPLRGVVAITFTRKAAREMRNRVRSEVRGYLERPDLAGKEQARWQAIYTGLDAARIGTIHSLCGELLRAHPAETGIDPRFAALEEGQMALLRARAVEAALAWASDDAGAVQLFQELDEQGLQELVAWLLERRLDLEETRARLPGNVWPRWREMVVQPIAAFLDSHEVQNAFTELLGLRADGTLARAAGDKLAAPLAELLTLWDAIVAARAADDWETLSRQLRPLRGAMKQVGSKRYWEPANPKAVIKILQQCYDEHLAPWIGAQGIDLALDRRVAGEMLPQVWRLYEQVTATYAQMKAAQQALDFDDLEHGALTLLETNPDVLTRWQAEAAALLVDEFQDTNDRQRRLVRLLNGGRGRLFIVGDGKQSIYRFRGADVTVFRQEREQIYRDGNAVELQTSYRAHQELVLLLNRLMAPVLGEADAARPWVEPFAALRPFRESPATGLQLPFVRVHIALGSKEDGALERAATLLATRLVEMIEDGEVKVEAEDPDTGARAVRPLDYGDIAILCRASTSFPAYENALERAGIPFLTVAGGGFYDRPEVRELLNALRALAMPSDDLALAGLLRSPACGLSDVALYRLVKARAEGATLWQTLQSVALHDLEDEATRAAAARDLIAHLHVQAGRVPVADLLKQLLDAAGYRAALLRAGQARAARNAAKLLADAHRAGMVNIGAFLDYVGQVRDAGTREGEARTLETGAVQLMTVHAAKGLEFPVVVIGEAQRGEAGGPRAGQGHLLDPGLGPVLALKNEAGAASAIHRLASQVEQDQEAAESARLYYVAATRARELLILNGVGNARANGTLSLSGWLGQSAATLNVNDHVSCDRQGEAAHRITLEIDGHPVSVEILEPGATPPERIARAEMKPEDALPETLPLLRSCLPAEPETAVPMGDAGAPDAERIARDPPRRVWRVVPGAGEGAPAWVVGALVHEALAHWRFPGDASLDFDAWLGARARTYGLVDDRRIANAAQRAIRLLRRFQTSALFAKMDAAPVRRHEAPYSLRDDDGRVENGIFDALFCTSGGDWTLVDFKIDRVRDTAALDTLLAESDYVAQMARYLRAAGYLLGQRPTPVLCFLDVGGTVQLITDRWT